MLRRPARLQVSSMVRKADHLIDVANVDPLRVRSRRIKLNSIRLFQAAGEHLHLFRFAVAGHTSEDANTTGFRLCQKNVAVRRGSQQSRIVESGGIEFHLESWGRNRPGV